MRVLYYRLLGARFVIDTFWPVELPFGNGSGESSECCWIVPGTIEPFETEAEAIEDAQDF